ncbi:MAG: NAD-binding protein [Balneolaceae bacterium]|nr:NAD-binding protein [Balneolaceae bacterium]
MVEQEFEREERGYGSVSHSNHVVICEYTAFADELIREIQQKHLFPARDVVLIGSLVERSPYPEYDFIYGIPISPKVQERANISRASVIFVFANIRFSDPDTKTLHVVSRIMERNTDAPIYVELHDQDHPLLAELPRPVTVMNSDDLLHSALQHNYLDIEEYLQTEIRRD